jgi:HD-like signal output (HDOD) protein
VKARRELSAADVDDLIARLERRLDDGAIPTLPHVAVRVLQLVGDDGASLRDFAEVIQTDRGLSGRLLRLANSAYFAQRKPVSTLQRATVLIGLDRLKAIALGFHISRAAGGADAALVKRVWTLNLFRAWLAHRLAEVVERSVAGEAFLVSLLADAGEPLLLEFQPEPEKGYPWTATPARRFHYEFHSLAFTHVDVAASLARFWRLPPVLTRPIALHHTPPKPPGPNDPAGVLHAVAYIVGSLHLDAPGDADRHVDRLAAAARHLLRLNTDALTTAVRHAGQDFEATRDIFGHIIDDQIDLDTIVEAAHGALASQVERLTLRDLDHEAPAAGTMRLDAGGLVFEIEQRPPAGVTVYIADSSGKRLISEQIDLTRQSAEQVREMLLLDEAPDDEFAAVLDSIRKTAA